MAGQRCKGVGVDCVRFVAAIWDELAGKRTTVPRLPQDSGLHALAGEMAMRTYRAIAENHPVNQIRPSDGILQIEAGDLIAVRTGARGGPGHVMIAGSEAHRTYHAAVGYGVRCCPLPPIDCVFHVWRVKDRSLWLPSS